MKAILEKLKNLLPKKKEAKAPEAAVNENTATQGVNVSATEATPADNTATENTAASAAPVDEEQQAKVKKRRKIIYGVVALLVGVLIIDFFIGGSTEPTSDSVAEAENAMKEKIAKRGKRGKKNAEAAATEAAKDAQAATPVPAADPNAVPATETPAVVATAATPENANAVADSVTPQAAPVAEPAAATKVEAQVQQSLEQVSDEVAKKIETLEPVAAPNTVSEEAKTVSAAEPAVTEKVENTLETSAPPVNNELSAQDLKGTAARDVAKAADKIPAKPTQVKPEDKTPQELKVMEEMTVDLKELDVPAAEDIAPPTTALQEEKKDLDASASEKKKEEELDLTRVGENEKDQDSFKKVDLKEEQLQESKESKNLVADLEAETRNKSKDELAKDKTAVHRKPTYDFPGRGLVYNCQGKHWACVDRVPYLQCQEHNNWAKANSKSPECVPDKIYLTDEDCHLAQMSNINKLVKTHCYIKN